MQRHERLEQDVKVALSRIITYEVKDPAADGLISVTDVKITPDQKYAKVFISIYGKKNKDSLSGQGRIFGSKKKEYCAYTHVFLYFCYPL